MAGGLSSKGDGREGRSLGQGYKDGRGGRSRGRRPEDRHGVRPISLGHRDAYGSIDGNGGRPTALGSRVGYGRGNGHGNLSSPPPTLQSATTTQSSTSPATLQRVPTTQSFAPPREMRCAPTTQSSAPPQPTRIALTTKLSTPPPSLHRTPTTQSPSPPPVLQCSPPNHTPSHTTVADDESPPQSPIAPAARTSVGDQVITPSENSSSSSSKPLLKIAHKINFTPSHVASGQITKYIKQRFDKEGYTWSAVSQQTKEYYWNEFQKHFSFDRDLAVVRDIFERRAAIRYSGTLCEWRKSGKRPVNVPQETWDSWQKEWNTLKFKNKCLKASQNCLSEVVGQGNGPSTHTGGSRSAIDHSIILAKDLGRPVTDYDVFVRMHKKKNRKFVDKRSEDVAEKVIARYDAATQNQIDDGENSSETIDLSAIYYEVVGPLKKKRVYGLGSKPSAVISDPSSSKSALLERDQMRAELYEEMREEMIKRQEEMEQQMRERQELMELEWKKKQQEMEDFIQRFMRGGGPSAPPTDAYPTDDDYAEDPDLDDDEE